MLFSSLEPLSVGCQVLTKDLMNSLVYNDQGLIPCIAQHYQTNEVLMMAWMNETALNTSLENGFLCFFSRKRQSLWLKGETSGHYLQLNSLFVDCDGDTLLAKVDPLGEQCCHTYRQSCFYVNIDKEFASITESVCHD